jgi:hypothetical protein
MKYVKLIVIIAIWHLASGISYAQQVNGQTVTFPKGKTEWSDTIHKKLLTKEMAKQGLQPVPLAIRYKLVKKTSEGSLYDIEITNQSTVTKIKFKVVLNQGRDAFTVKLGPKQTKIIEKLNWKGPATGRRGIDTYNENLDFPFEEMMHEHD